MTKSEAIEFTDRDMGLITLALPAGCDRRRVALLPEMLRDWAANDLRYHLPDESAIEGRNRRERVGRIGKAADNLLCELKGLDQHEKGDQRDRCDWRGRRELLAQIAVAEGMSPVEAIFSVDIKKFDAMLKVIATLAVAAKTPLTKPKRGRPHNISALLVLRDLAAIYAYVTDLRPTRRVDPKTGDESGPFCDFARAVWPVIFRRGDDGLLSTMRIWAEAQKEFTEQESAAVAHIAMRNPAWGI